MPDSEIGELTAAELDALLDRHKQALRHDALCAGIVAAVIVNSNPYRDPNAQTMSPADFVGGDEDELSEEEKTQLFMQTMDSWGRSVDRKAKKLEKNNG